MRVGLFLVVSLFCSRSLADQWDPFTGRGTGDGFTPTASTTTTSHPVESSPSDSGWYGDVILGVDAVSLGLFAAAIPTKRGELALVGFGGYLVGAPIVHTAHEHGAIAMPSVGLRLGLFALGGRVGVSATDDEDLGTRIQALLVGALVGGVTASGIDAGAFAWEPARRARIEPTVSIHDRAGWVGARGVF